ncbi:MAG TPA: SCO family protein [Candidatus Saccharimonadales bacterium]|nr:SCO family protein [Candidatus Saccharimonadales bacterium]
MRKLFISVLCVGAISLTARPAELPDPSGPNTRAFAVRGVVRELNPDEQTVIISNEAISNYMDAMTMPFKVRDSNVLKGLRPGDQVAFRLHVTSTDSWVDQIVRVGAVSLPLSESKPATVELPPARGRNSLWYYDFTNEFGRPVGLSDFHGQALAITFFYTRCPLPNFCPRLSKNFEEASQKLKSLPGAPTNWHFLSISFDPQFDTPAMLKAYGESYQYDSKHWSFLTGPPDKIAELARQSGVRFESDNGLINHNFRTLIVDANGHLQTVFPISGDFSDSIVAEIIKAAAVTNQAAVAR